MPSQDSEKPTFQSNLKKFTAIGSKPTPESFPQLVDCVEWVRLALAIGYGTWLGAGAKDRGGAGIMFGLNTITFLPILYCSIILRADAESFGSSLYFGGVWGGICMFLLIWVYFYTLSHEAEELQLSELLQNGTISKNIIDAVPEAGDGGDQSEF